MDDSFKWQRLTIPEIIPVFPLREALLLPHSQLPLNIFEPRYIEMVNHALGHQRVIGMVRGQSDQENSPLYDSGCLGLITSFMETDDRRYLITLTGITRFNLAEEYKAESAFRMYHADFSPFDDDLIPPAEISQALRHDLLDVLQLYLQSAALDADWEAAQKAPSAAIVNSVAMSGAFAADEKQALLEAKNIEARTKILMALMEMTIVSTQNDGDGTPPRIQ